MTTSTLAFNAPKVICTFTTQPSTKLVVQYSLQFSTVFAFGLINWVWSMNGGKNKHCFSLRRLYSDVTSGADLR